MLNARPEGRDRRLVGAILVLGVIALFFLVVEQIATVFFYFGDILLTFFLAWLLAFIISPVVTRIVDAVPRLPRAVAAVMRLHAGRGRHGPDRRRRRRRAGHLDRPVRRIDPGASGPTCRPSWRPGSSG